MKHTKCCPKCGSNDLLYITPYGMDGQVIPSGFLSAIYLRRYICGSCGYSEEWVDLSDIPALKKTFDPIDSEDAT